jgi:predicted 3-demethylubiquinone-9 3-methyltransferase (glyoxalase superfamily)
MPKITPFLWFNDNAGEAADFYLALFPNARKLSEVRSKGVGPWPEGKIATISIEFEGQHVTFMNGGPAHQLSEAFSFTLLCKDQPEIDHYWSAFLDAGGRELACGWIKDHFGLCWQVVPENMGQLINNPGGMAAMMQMKKLDIAALKAAATQ